MAACFMPILIKVEMTKENYRLLLKKAAEVYHESYLQEYYRFDGRYFTLDNCCTDDPDMFDEAGQIAKYAQPTEQCVGLIYAGFGAPSFAFQDLYFRDGKCILKEHPCDPSEDRRKCYAKRRLEFLRSFPKDKEGER